MARGMNDGVEGSMDGSGVGVTTIVVSCYMDGSKDCAWTATAVSSEWLLLELMKPRPLRLMMM